jgi:HAD superfamily hydrolase (TIGR01490 family)
VAVEAAFFDLDKTVISRASSLALGRPMYRAGLVSRRAVLRGAYAQLVFKLFGADHRRMEKVKDALLALTRGWDQAEVEQLVREVVIVEIDPFVYEEALDLMDLHRSEGRSVFIVSSSPEEVVRPLAEHFGANGVLATRAQIEDGKYTGELDFYCFGEGKAEAMRALADSVGIDLERSYAYSDSATDLPMLEAVGNPVAVNPSRNLRREAEARNWQIRDFRRPVRLEPRESTVTPGRAVSAMAAAVAIGAVVAWLYFRPRKSQFPSVRARV